MLLEVQAKIKGRKEGITYIRRKIRNKGTSDENLFDISIFYHLRNVINIYFG